MAQKISEKIKGTNPVLRRRSEKMRTSSHFPSSLAAIKKDIDAYVSVIEREIPVSRVLLFGSHAKGTARLGSDIDIAIISPALGKGARYDRRWLVRKIWDVPFKNMDVLGFSPKEFRGDSPILDEIRKTGIVVR